MDGRTRHLGRARQWSRRKRLLLGITGLFVAVGVAGAATLWIVGLEGGSSAEAQAQTISNLTISAVAPSGSYSKLYPGSTGDAFLDIHNPNGFPVTVTQVKLPTAGTYADGYTDASLSTPAGSGCDSSTSGVSWNFADGGFHPLTAKVTVAAGGDLTVQLTNDASMALSSPAACAGLYFKMPSLTGITASSADPATEPVMSGTVTSGWTS